MKEPGGYPCGQHSASGLQQVWGLGRPFGRCSGAQAPAARSACGRPRAKVTVALEIRIVPPDSLCYPSVDEVYDVGEALSMPGLFGWKATGAEARESRPIDIVWPRFVQTSKRAL